MVHRRKRWFAGVVMAGALLATATAGAADDAPKRQPMFGAGFDLGVPDGIGVNVFFRPVRFVRLQAGPLYNIAGWGIRGGATFIPFDWVVSPTLTVEGGHYFSGNANNIVGLFQQGGIGGELGAALSNLRYTFANAQLGLEIGSARSVMFMLHFGLSYVVVTSPGIGQALQQASGDPSLQIADPTVRFVAPSAKLGLMFFFG